ncbi:uncharacterized protein LOC124945204 [Impatiens glandulifera]|uniref:uncharacterized protein LOC124945204 n=1 Tax=Impatiens glandulifera TaxID=253017 RepID=UPI001FB11960|nr:uncharacterized protein LOC124945204 [Impatiens glandulifera]
MASSMDSKQLIDSLTAHMSLYHSSSTSTTPVSSLPTNPRSSILNWFSSLSPHQRQSHLTVVDFNFTQILLQMQEKLISDGHGFFIVLPDIPSGDRPGLPSLCYRRSHGLLARTSETNKSERLIHDSVRLFNSKEGERLENSACCSQGSKDFLDSITVCESFVENVESFIASMDEMSNGSFLRGEENGLCAKWAELEWLKNKGYYSIGAFVVNRLEVALRLSWLNCHAGKKRGVKLKDKVGMSGIAANVYWRKKGCIEWWTKLDVAMRRKIFQTFFGKAAKSLVSEMGKGANGTCHGEICISCAESRKKLRLNRSVSSQGDLFCLSQNPAERSGKYPSYASSIFGLFILEDIVTLLSQYQHSEYGEERVFFSSLISVSTISDFIFRKFRDLLMLVSLDCTKLELLEEDSLTLSSKKSNEKVATTTTRKKKSRSRNTKRQNPVQKSSGNDPPFNQPTKDHDNGSTCTKGTDSAFPNGAADKPQIIKKEHCSKVVNDNVKRVSRKGKNKESEVKKVGLGNAVEVILSECKSMDADRPSASQGEANGPGCGSGDCVVLNGSKDVLSSIGSIPKLDTSNLVGEQVGGNNLVQITRTGSVVSAPESRTELNHGGIPNVKTDKHTADADGGTVKEMPSNIPVTELDVSQSKKVNLRGYIIAKETDTKPMFSEVTTRVVDVEGQNTYSRESRIGTGSINSLACHSHEWPRVPLVHLSSFNSHLPAATDRLHLDVSYNWKNHFLQSFSSSVPQIRNSRVEKVCSQVVACPLPMSLDWPPMVRNGCGLAPAMACGYDSGFISRRQSSFQSLTRSMHKNAIVDDEWMYSGDFAELSDMTSCLELGDDQESHWVSEEELEMHAVSGMDYNQHFGGGVMYWNPSDYPTSSFSRPPSLSSDDGLWACREADMNRTVDDMVSFSSSYSTNGLTSPSAASFCSPFDPLGPAHQSVSYVVPGKEISGKLLHSSSTISESTTEEKASGSYSSKPCDGEAKLGDSLPYPILPPIIVSNVSRERTRADFKLSHDLRSPCVPPSRREQPRIKRPPSPVVLCVPHAPRPPPPPVSDARKHRGFPTVRSGSSSPRHWGLKGVYHDAMSFEEACMRVDGIEVVWPSWRNKSLMSHAINQGPPEALLQDHLIAISHLSHEQEHPDLAFPLEPPELPSCPSRKASLSSIHSLLHDEIDAFCKQIAERNLIRKPYINWAVKRVARSLQVLWPRSRTNVFGSNATGLSLPTSDVDLVVCLPPVRNLEPIKEAGILEGRNGIKETCLQHAARYLANQEWVRNDSLKIVENTAIPIIMLVVEVPHDLIIPAASTISTSKGKRVEVLGEQGDTYGVGDGADNSSRKDAQSIHLDISFKSSSHTGLQTTELVKGLTEQFPAATFLALVLKQFLADRSLDQSYSGGLSSYCLILLITRFLQHEHHHGRPINQNFGGLLMDFLYFFGNLFDPRQMRVSVRGSGLYINRERGYSIDPICIDDPLFPTNNVGRNCFRIHQCIKAFADAYSTLESEFSSLPIDGDLHTRASYNLLSTIIPSIDLV